MTQEIVEFLVTHIIGGKNISWDKIYIFYSSVLCLVAPQYSAPEMTLERQNLFLFLNKIQLYILSGLD